ncbi:MAG: glutamate-1-semialdehyde 2,1-aminomutase [Rubricoccaceae bacterium]
MTPLDDAAFRRSRAHQARAHALVPGGAHTYARGDDQMPESMPVVVARGQGCRVWDVDGNAFVEYGMGLRAVTLGHAHPRVNAAAAEWLARGACFSRPAAVELEAAETFLGLVSTAEMVKFCKDGSSATTAALKLARAATGRDMVAYCADHPFLSQDDWFIGTTPMDAGIPAAVKALSVGFRYGDAATLEALFDAHPGRIAAVILEPARGTEDARPFLLDVQRLCQRHGAVFVLDEMITGFRWHARGAQHLYGVTPDLSTFGKAMANGFAVSALAGRRDLMERGGLRTPHERVFLLSSTHGAETHALAAAAETMRIYAEEPVVERMEACGRRLADGLTALARQHDVAHAFEVFGRMSNLVFITRDAEGNPSQMYRTLFLQEMTRRGVLAPSFVLSAAHDAAALEATLEAADAALAVYADALAAGSAERFLAGRPVQPVFRKQVGVVWSPPRGESRSGPALAPPAEVPSPAAVHPARP